MSRELRTGVPWELLHADDLVLISKSLDDCISKFEKWKLEIEIKRMRVNSKKTKFMLLGSENLKDSGAFPCSVCRKGVSVNSVFCSTCFHWVHKRCSGLTGRLKDQAYVCPRCLNLAPPLDYRPITEIIVGNATMYVYIIKIISILDYTAVNVPVAGVYSSGLIHFPHSAFLSGSAFSRP